MNSFKVGAVKSGSHFSADLVIDKTFLVLHKDGIVSDTLLSALREWRFIDVYSEGSMSNEPIKPLVKPKTDDSVSDSDEEGFGTTFSFYILK